MRFLLDEQAPPALSRKLRRKGHEAEHCRDVGLAGAGDSEMRAYARKMRAVLVTKDDDFADPARQDAPPVVWIRLGNVANEALWRALEPALPEIVDALKQGEVLIEVK